MAKRSGSSERRLSTKTAIILCPWIVFLVMLTGCATGQYGFEWADTTNALENGEGQRALAFYEPTAIGFEDRGRTLQAARAYGAAAFLAYRLGKYETTIQSGNKALRLLELGGHSAYDFGTGFLSLYSSLGHAYRLAGDRVSARRYYLDGLNAAPPSRDYPVSAVFLRGLAYISQEEGKHQEALEESERALQEYRNALSRTPTEWSELRRLLARDVSVTALVVGRSQVTLGQLDEAEGSFRTARDTAKGIHDPIHQAFAMGGLGRVFHVRGQYSLAIDSYQDMLKIMRARGLHSSTIGALAAMARAYAAQGRQEEALDSYRQAVAEIETIRGGFGAASLRATFLDNQQSVYDGAIRAALELGRAEDGFDYAERARARTFLDLLGTRTVLSKGRTAALVEEEVRLRAQLALVRAAVQARGEDGSGLQGEIEAAERAYLAFLERIRAENAEQASLMNVEPITVREAQGLLPAGTRALEYFVGEDETVVWVLDRQRLEVVRLAITRNDLVKRVDALRSAIEEGGTLGNVHALGQDLYQRLIGPAIVKGSGERLLIAPHDVLHYVPFAALRTPGGRWLMEEYVITTVPSASVLKYLQEKEEGALSGALAIGNPDVGRGRGLRYAEREAQEVGERFPGSIVLVKAQATEGRVKSVSGRVGILHFATHGELNQQEPLSSALLLVPDGVEDGRLEVREIFGLDLHARLVVLSACETGLGQLSRGDELVGLQRAFLYAGSPAVVTTLWKVDDRASFLLMREFYSYLTTLGAAGALRRAQMRVFADFPDPLFWAGFVLTGLGR